MLTISDKITIMSAVASILLTVVLFYLSYRFEKKADQRSTVEFTHTYMNNVTQLIDKSQAEKIQLEGVKPPFHNVKYIESNPKIESLVFVILNQYSSLGASVKNNVVDQGVVLNLRRDAIIETWKFYEYYIIEYRKKHQKKDAWEDFEYLYNQAQKIK